MRRKRSINANCLYGGHTYAWRLSIASSIWTLRCIVYRVYIGEAGDAKSPGECLPDWGCAVSPGLRWRRKAPQLISIRTNWPGDVASPAQKTNPIKPTNEQTNKRSTIKQTIQNKRSTNLHTIKQTSKQAKKQHKQIYNVFVCVSCPITHCLRDFLFRP